MATIPNWSHVLGLPVFRLRDGQQVRLGNPKPRIPVHLSDEAAQKIAAHLHSLMTPRGSYSGKEFQAYISQVLSRACHLITPKPGDLLVSMAEIEMIGEFRKKWPAMYYGNDPKGELRVPENFEGAVCPVEFASLSTAATPAEEFTPSVPTWRDRPSMLGPAG